MIVMNRLRELRENVNMTQIDVGQALGLSAAAIGRYESEKRNLTPKLIARFCEFYHVSADYLLGLDEIMPTATSPAAATDVAPNLLEVAKIIATLTPERDKFRGGGTLYLDELEIVH